MRFVVLLTTVFFFSASLNAEKYRIKKIVGCSSIIIGGVKKKKGDIFNDTEKITYGAARKLYVICVKTGQEKTWVLKELDKYKIRTIEEEDIRLASLATKSQFSIKQREYFLVDSIHIPAYEVRENQYAITEWITINGDTISAPINRTSDKLFYIVTSSIYNDLTPPDSILLTIREINKTNGYNNPIYRNLKVFFDIPSSPKMRKKKKKK